MRNHGIHVIPWVGALAACLVVAVGCPEETADDDDTTWPQGFEGQLVVNSTHDGVVACDAVIDLVGSRYSGTCEGCDFAFALDATLAQDDGTGDCVFEPRWSYLAGGDFTELLLAHAPSFTTEGWYGTYTFDDALLTGYTLAGTGAGPYWWMLSHADAADASFSRVGDALTWSYAYQGLVDRDPYHNDCGDVTASDAEAGFAGAVVAMSELACDGSVADVWSFEGSAGETASITVDTVASDTAFDPRLYLNRPDGCTHVTADDNFDCTFPPPSYACPAVELPTDDGTYEVVVLAAGSCVGEVAGYSIRVDGPAGATLQLAVDDQPIVVEVALEVSGSGQITP